MKVAYIIFDGITWLDFFGVYDPVSRLKSMGYLPELEWEICAKTANCADNFGLRVPPTKKGETLDGFDAIIVPGGYGTRPLQADNDFLDWIRTASPASWKISICTGSLILGAAGFLKDKMATSHFSEYDNLRPYCRTVSTDRIVEDGNTITAGAVTSSLDLGLYLCEKWSGHLAAAEIRKRMDYRG